MNRTIIFIFVLLVFPCANLRSEKIPQYYCTAICSGYFNLFLNLLGSIHHTNFDQLEEIAVFDLGLRQDQIDYLQRVKKLKIYRLEQINPSMFTRFAMDPRTPGKDVPGWYSWKPVAIKQSLDMFPYVLWIDAGSTVLKPLDNLFSYIKDRGYFLVTVGNREPGPDPLHPVGWGATRFFVEAFNLDRPENRWVLDQEFVMGGIIGVSRIGKKDFLLPLYECAKDIRYFEDDGSSPNGRACAGKDQGVMSAIAYLRGLHVFQQDHRQENPILLDNNGILSPLYITWDPRYFCSKTSIYSSRGDIRNAEFYKKQIKYKN